MSTPLVVTKTYEGRAVKSWWQPATQTNRELNRDKPLARFNQPRTSETYRRQDDVSGYELQFQLSGMLPGFPSLMCCPSIKVIESDSKRFFAIGGLHKQMDAAAELGRDPISKHLIQPEDVG